MILPAILETDPKKQFQRMEELSRFSNILHTDIMDGRFVKKNNVRVLKELATNKSSVDWELHLMVQEPVKLYSAIRKVKGVRRIVLPIESDWKLAFDKFKKYYEVGISLKSETPLSVIARRAKRVVAISNIDNLQGKIARFDSPRFGEAGRRQARQASPSPAMTNDFDFIQLLSVTPGAQGNSFHPSVYRKVKKLKRLFPKLRIEIDGAMNPTRIRKLNALGVKDFVVGSYLKEGSVARRIALLRGL